MEKIKYLISLPMLLLYVVAKVLKYTLIAALGVLVWLAGLLGFIIFRSGKSL